MREKSEVDSQYAVVPVIPKETSSMEKSPVLADVVSPMPSTVTRVSVHNGDKVKKGDLLVVVEAMKMEVGMNKGSYD